MRRRSKQPEGLVGLCLALLFVLGTTIMALIKKNTSLRLQAAQKCKRNNISCLLECPRFLSSHIRHETRRTVQHLIINVGFLGDGFFLISTYVEFSGPLLAN